MKGMGFEARFSRHQAQGSLYCITCSCSVRVRFPQERVLGLGGFGSGTEPPGLGHLVPALILRRAKHPSAAPAPHPLLH